MPSPRVTWAPHGRSRQVKRKLLPSRAGQPGGLSKRRHGGPIQRKSVPGPFRHLKEVESCGALHSPCGGPPQQRGPLTPQHAQIGFTPAPTNPGALHTRARPCLLSRHRPHAQRTRPHFTPQHWLLCHVGFPAVSHTPCRARAGAPSGPPAPPSRTSAFRARAGSPSGWVDRRKRGRARMLPERMKRRMRDPGTVS